MILVDPNEEVLIPVNNGIFEVSQFKSQSKLNQEYKGCFILFSDGSIKNIVKITKNGFYGKSFREWLFSALNSTYSVTVDLESSDIGLADLKVQLTQYIRSDNLSPDPYLPQTCGIDTAVSKIQKANDTKALYESLEVPPEYDCLDVL
ncbi:hypothetical protein [Gynuella sp.]|uniref:hypothetical protein n=1 Tax=Gynuella sp. TaxID=2969146 RepID=UPI003D09B9EB